MRCFTRVCGSIFHRVVLGAGAMRSQIHSQWHPERVTRHFIPGTAPKHTSAGFWRAPAPLFEEKRNAGCDTLVSYTGRPLRLHWASVRSALSADDDPMDPS